MRAERNKEFGLCAVSPVGLRLPVLRQTHGMSGLSVLGVESSSSLEDLALGNTSTLYQQTQIQYVICNRQCLEPWGKLEEKKERLFTISLIFLMFHLNSLYQYFLIKITLFYINLLSKLNTYLAV